MVYLVKIALCALFTASEGVKLGRTGQVEPKVNRGKALKTGRSDKGSSKDEKASSVNPEAKTQVKMAEKPKAVPKSRADFLTRT